MKSVFVVCLFVLVSLAIADPLVHERGCRYIMGRCVEPCPEGTHAYSTGCSRRHPEPTCDQPNPVQEEHIMCDYSSCYCDPPTVRDSKTSKCVAIEKCPKKE